MTEPTQTPRTDAALCVHQGTPELFIKASVGRELERDLATATQRIAELESQLRTQATEHSLANRRLEDEIGKLREELEDCERELRFAPPPKRRAHLWRAAIAKSQQALSPSPPAVAGAVPWTGANPDEVLAFGLPAPPVQTEEKPATVPLAVAEKLAEALERQCPVSDSLLRLKDSALAQFNALTK